MWGRGDPAAAPPAAVTGARAPRAPAVMLAALLTTLAAGIAVPLYSDEVGWRFQLSRFVQDGGVDRAIEETCGANTVATPPVWMWPVRLFSSGVTWLVDDPLGVRLAGIGGAVLAVLAVRLLVRRLLPPSPGRAQAEVVAYAALGLGLFPWLLLWSRPEQPLLLALLGALLLAFGAPAAAREARAGARLAGIVALALVALCYHPKAVFYLPGFVAAAAVARPRGSWWGLAAALLVMALAAGSAFGYWSHRFACPDDPLLAAKLARENVSVGLLADGWQGVARLAPQLWTDLSPRSYVQSTVPALPVMSAWLPASAIAQPVRWAWVLLVTVGWEMAAVLGIAALVRAGRDPARSAPRLAAGLAVFACAVGWSALQINKNAYEAALYLPAMLVAGLLVGSATRRPGRLAAVLVPAIAAISLASQALLLAAYLPRLLPARGGYVADQPYSISPFHYDRVGVAKAGARCGLAPRPGLSRVLVDDGTYFTYAGTRRPLYRLGVLSVWSGGITDPGRWLHAHGSPGAVLACAYLPPSLRRRAIASGPLCCVDTR